MKTLYLIKFADHQQIGHLYEHLFLMQLGDMLRGRGLHAYLDFLTQGSTFKNGAVYVTIHLYSSAAQSLESDILNFAPSFTNQTITNGLLQISAEKFSKVSARDDAVLLRKLAEYQAQSWQDLSSFGARDTTVAPMDHTGLELKEVPERMVLYAKQTITLAPALGRSDRAVYVPLFYLVSHILINDLAELLATRLGYYSYDASYEYKTGKYTETTTFLVYDTHDLTDELAITREYIRSIDVLRLIESLVVNANEGDIDSTPSISNLLDRTGIAVGCEGWKKIVTEDAVREVLHALTITYRIGKHTASTEVSSYLRSI